MGSNKEVNDSAGARTARSAAHPAISTIRGSSIGPGLDGPGITAEHFRALVLATSQIVWITSADGHMVADSPSARAFTGQTYEQWKGLGWLDALHPDDRERTRHLWLEAMASGCLFRAEQRMRRPDGSYTPVLARAAPVRNPDGSIREWLGSYTDITEPRHAEECLREQIRINELLCRLGVSLARELDHQTLVQLVTDEATALSGAHFGAFLFKAGNGTEVYKPYALSGANADAFAAFVTPATTPLFAATFRGETVIRLHDIRTDPRFSRGCAMLPGCAREVRSYLAVPVLGRAGEVLGGLFLGHEEVHRFTESHVRLVGGLAAHAATALENARLYRALKHSEIAARRAYDAAKRAERRKDEFLAMLGHELRNPLAPIVTALEVLRLKRGNAPQHRELQVIERQVRHLTGLVDDLLDISRITRGKVELERSTLNLAEVVAKAVEMASPLLEARSHALDIAVPPDLLVEGDPRRLVQVISNLVTNAAKYTEPGGRIAVVGAREGDEAVLRVRDNGIGIPGELLPHVFDLFTQAERALDRKAGGLGIGLSVVKNLVSLHGGDVSAHSDGPDQGSEFVIRLPTVRIDADEGAAAGRGSGAEPDAEQLAQPTAKRPTPSAADAEQLAQPTAKRPTPSAARVLVVDDNADAAYAVMQVLALLGYECRVAHDGPAALALAPAFMPDVAILDIGLPVMDGYELAIRLRGLPGLANMRLIAVTGYGQQRDRARSAQAGIETHLIKPVRLAALREALQPDDEARP